jgi:hypothetical protein
MSTRVFVAAALAAAAMMPVTASAQPNAYPADNPYPAENPPPAARADQPLVRVPPPRELTYRIDGGAGILGYVSGAGGIGPAWNVRAAANITPRFAAEAEYDGAVNKRPTVDSSIFATLVSGSVRYNLLLADQAPLQPYVTAGLGYGAFVGSGGDGGTLIVPLSLGVERALTRNINVGARFTFRPAFFDDLSIPVATGLPFIPPQEAGHPGADTYELVANVGGAF